MRSSTLDECIALAIESASTDPVEALLAIYRAIDAGYRPSEIRDRLPEEARAAILRELQSDPSSDSRD